MGTEALAVRGRPADSTAATLRQRLADRPADRFPIDHATTRYHLGLVLASADDLGGAEESLVEAARLFEHRLPVEWARTLNALGAVLRAGNRPHTAEAAFRHAARVFGEHRLHLDHAAATFNLGLAVLDQGRHEEAARWFEQAGSHFPAGAAPVQRSAARREQGAALLLLERPAEALEALQEARELAETASDPDGVAAAANVAGLALLELDRAEEARSAFATSLANAPAATRSGVHAMARANLALACERTGDHRRARFLARQVVTMPAVETAVSDMAREILLRVGDRPGGLVRLLLDAPADEHVPLVRAEMGRWSRLDEVRLEAEIAAWIDEQPTDRSSRAAVAEPWLAALLELPPPQLDRIAAAVNAALVTRPAEVAEPFRAGVSAAMVRFHQPQWRRLQAVFDVMDASRQASPWT